MQGWFISWTIPAEAVGALFTSELIMRAEVQNTVEKIRKSVDLLAQRLNVETAPYRLEEFNARVEDPTLWDDPAAAQKLMRDRQALVDAMATHDGIATELQDNIDLIELGEMEEDAEVVAEAEAALSALAVKAAQKELEALLDGEADGNDTFLEINSGAGGTESCDWASMLARMYVRWAEKKGYTVELQSESAGEEANIQPENTTSFSIFASKIRMNAKASFGTASSPLAKMLKCASTSTTSSSYV